MDIFIKKFNGEDIVGTFYEKELQKTDQKKFRVEKLIKRKRDMSNGKAMIILFIVGLIKNYIVI